MAEGDEGLKDVTPHRTEESSGFDWYSAEYSLFEDKITARITFERLADGDNGAIWSEARAWITVEGEERNLIPPTRVNLMNSTRGGGWKSLVDVLSDAATDVQWNETVSNCVGRAIEVYRTGDVEQALSPQHVDRTSHPMLLDPFVASSGVSVFFGEGGTGKSLIALGMAVAIASGHPVFGTLPRATGPVVYFDYEDDPEVHAERLAAILSGTKAELKHPIYHRSLIAKVSQSQSSMRRSVAETGSVLAILDSVGMGRGGNANTAEDTVRLFRALRSLEVPVLAVDHVTKEDKRSGSMISPYGSVYTINSARLLWGATVAQGLTTDREKYLNLVNTKANRSALHEKMGMKIAYHNQEDEELRSRWLDSVDFTTYDEWWDENEVSVWDLLVEHLSVATGSWTIKELAIAIGQTEEAVTKAVQRNKRSLLREKKGRAYAYRLPHGSEQTMETSP